MKTCFVLKETRLVFTSHWNSHRSLTNSFVYLLKAIRSWLRSPPQPMPSPSPVPFSRDSALDFSAHTGKSLGVKSKPSSLVGSCLLITGCKVLGQSLRVFLGQTLGLGWGYGWLILQRWLSLLLWSWEGASPCWFLPHFLLLSTTMEASISAAPWTESPDPQHVV